MVGVSGLVDKVVDGYQRDRDMLIQILLELQRGFGWLPEEALNEVSRQLGVPLTRVYQIATFYKAFSLTPKGRHLIRVCMGTACQVRGAPLIRDRVQHLIGVEPGGTTPDMRFTFETVNCLGCCAMGPVMTVDNDYHGHLPIPDVEKVIGVYK